MRQEEKKLIKNTILLIVGNFASKILVFLLVPLYTSLLSTEEYGIADLLITTVNLAFPIITLMISTAVLRFCLDKDGNSKQLLSVGFWIHFLGCVFVTLLSMLIFHNTSYSQYLWYFVTYYITYTFYTLILQYIKGLEKVTLYAVVGSINTIILIGCNILFLLFFHLGMQGYILSMIISYGGSGLLALLCSGAWKDIVSPCNIDKRTAISMIHYSIPLMPNSISWWVSNSSDRYIMNMYRTTNELGVYSVAYKIPSIMSTITGIMVNAWEISAVDDFGSDNNRRFFSRMYKYYFEMLIIVCVCIMMVVKPLASVLFQKDFYAAWIFVPALLFASVFNAMSAFLGTIFTAAKKTKYIFRTTMLGASINIVLNFALIPQYGAQGAAVATAISYLATYIARIVGSQRIMRLEINYYVFFIKTLLLIIMTIFACIHTLLATLIGVMFLLFERKYIIKTIEIILRKIKRLIRKE